MYVDVTIKTSPGHEEKIPDNGISYSPPLQRDLCKQTNKGHAFVTFFCQTNFWLILQVNLKIISGAV